MNLGVVVSLFAKYSRGRRRKTKMLRQVYSRTCKIQVTEKKCENRTHGDVNSLTGRMTRRRRRVKMQRTREEE